MPSSDNYELAREIVDAAPPQPFVLPTYTGGINDLGYLKAWVLGQVTSIYGVDASIFDTATVLSTSILRDFVHRAILEQPGPSVSAVDLPGFITWNDVAFEFRTGAKGLCGELATQEWQVFRAFGYLTNQINSMSGTPDSYTDTHATTEVYVSDLGKYIVQDASYNFAYRDGNGELLSWIEARVNNVEGQLVFDGFKDFSQYGSTGTYIDGINASLEAAFKEHYLRTTWSWLDSTTANIELIQKLFPNPATAHAPGSPQGGTYADVDAAKAAVADLVGQGLSWESSAAALRAQGYYTSGFALADAQGAHTEEWITLRVATGDYVSISRAGAVLNGSFDQLQYEASGDSGVALNPGVDLGAFLRATYILAADGTVMNAGVAMPTAVDVFGTADPETLTGTGGVDRMLGYGGDDTLDGTGGADVGMGGPGNDTYYVHSGTERVIELPGEGADVVNAFVDYVLPGNVEALNLLGAAVKGTIVSGEGSVYGNAGNNLFESRGAIGHLYGGAGSDVYFLDNAATTIVELSNEGGDTVYAYVDYMLPANVETMNLKGAAIRGTIVSGDGAIYGNASDNILDARGAIGRLIGGTGNDTYFADNPATVIVEKAGEGTDTVYAYSDYTLPANVEIMNLYGSAVRGTVSSGEGWLSGNANDNILDSRGALGYLFGGAGDDTYYLSNGSSMAIENPDEGTDTVHATLSYVLPADIENLILDGAANIDGTGNALANIITGNSGANVLNGLAGADTAIGGAGNDNYLVDDAADSVVENAGQGTDTVYAYCDYAMPANVEVLNLYGTAVQGTIATGTGWIYGNANSNVLDSRGAIGYLYGGPGDDTYYVSSASSMALENADEGTDTVRATASFTLAANVENLILDGSASINGTGNAQANTVTGNGGANVLNGLGGADTLIGGAGNDNYFVDDPADSVVEDASAGTDTAYAYCDYAMPANVEVLNLKGAAIQGTIATGTGWIWGNANNNILDSRGAVGYLFGGTGDDTYYVSSTSSVAVENPGEGTDTVHASVSYTLAANLDNLILDGTASTSGTGNVLANVITGNSGDNMLNGLGGADTLMGGAGNDNYLVDDPADSVVENTGQGSDTVYAYCDYVMPANVETLNLKGTAISGTITTGEGAIYGNANDNILDARGAVARLNGSTGNDTYYVSSASSIAVEKPDEGTDTVHASVSYTLAANLENLILDGAANIDGTGNTIANALTGNSANNTLEGKGGVDILSGADGADQFVFGPADPGSTDQVTDFSSGQGDRLVIRAAEFGLQPGSGVGPGGSLDPGYFEVAEAATLGHAELLFRPSDATLYWDADGAGTNSTAVAVATFTLPVGADPSVFLHSTDFLLL